MSVADRVDLRLGSRALEPVVVSDFRTFSEPAYECRVLLCPEPAGGFSAYALRLPGVASQGETEDEALKNVTEAFRAAIETYTEEGMEIPWTDEAPIERTQNCLERWILVDG